MIDTDKYENITPERWTVDEEDPCRVMDVQECTIARTDFVDIDEEREWQLANAQLIADAPLLLAEVKGRRPPKVDGKYMAWSDSHPRHGRTSWIVEVMEGITDVGYWTWVNWQLEYGDEEE